MLTNVLDPSREVNPQFVNYVVVTNDGRTITGLIAAESAASVTLKRAENASDTSSASTSTNCKAPASRSCPRGWKSNSINKGWPM